VALLLAYARAGHAVGGRRAAVLNLPEPALFFMGRLRENVLIGAAARRRQARGCGIAAPCARASSRRRASPRSSARRGSRR
jgi:hypothetical protein